VSYESLRKIKAESYEFCVGSKAMLESAQRQISHTTDTLSTMVSNPWQIIEHIDRMIRKQILKTSHSEGLNPPLASPSTRSESEFTPSHFWALHEQGKSGSSQNLPLYQFSRTERQTRREHNDLSTDSGGWACSSFDANGLIADHV
jgi:hypothetical protein